MSIRQIIEQLPKEKQLVFFQKFSHFLNTHELADCMSMVEKGKFNGDLVQIHNSLGLFQKYIVDAVKLLEREGMLDGSSVQ